MWRVQNESSERAISKALGVVLMVAIVAVLAAVVGTMLIQQEPEERPSVATELSENVETYRYASEEVMTPGPGLEDGFEVDAPEEENQAENMTTEMLIEHVSGESIDAEKITLYIGDFEVPPVCTEDGGELDQQFPNESIADQLPEEYSAGEVMFAYPMSETGKFSTQLEGTLTGTTTAETQEVDTARVVWESESSHVLQTHEFDATMEVLPIENEQLQEWECIPPAILDPPTSS